MEQDNNNEKKGTKKKSTHKIRKIINISLWSCFLIGILLVVAVFYAITEGRIGYMPDFEQLENPIDRYASQIISEDGVVLGNYSSSRDNRIFVKYSELSPDLVKALIATEDNRYAKHSGIDLKGLMRAVIKRGILMQESGGGGSTITQQLAKQLYSPNAGNKIERVMQKPIEWVIAIRLEKSYTKEEIINMYLNKFDFLYLAVGIKTASQVYFNTTPKNLKIEEAATLIGMCKNPSYYNPVRYNDRAKGRRNTVLSQMVKYGYLDQVSCDSLQQLPLEIKFTRPDHKVGLAPYFREYLRMMLTANKPDRSRYASWQQQKFEEDSVSWETNPLYGWCNRPENRKPNGEPYNIYTDGLKIHVTLNASMQQYAEDAVREHIGKVLQPRFFREKRNDRFAPFNFDDLSEAQKIEEVNKILDRAVKQSQRYRSMKDAGVDEEEIEKSFKTKTEMSVFSWNGTIDTIMTPLDSIRYLKTFLRTAFMAMDSRTGHVKAYVGGIDYANFQYDMVTMGRRQVGSTMKPFVYSLAMIDGFTPCDRMFHVAQTLLDDNGEPWTPKNSTRTGVGEYVTLQWGLQNSSNWVTAYLMKTLSPNVLERLLRSFGMKGFIAPVIAMSLGSPDISVSEMVSGYSVFANKGLRIEPMYVTHIEDAYGNVVGSFAP